MIRGLLAGLAALGLIVAVLVLAKVDAGETARTLFNSAFGSSRAISGTLRETTPLLIAGLAVFVALRAGLFNIGVEGQLIVGALVSAVVALQMPGDLGLLAGVVGGAIAGALWALPAAWIRAYRGGHEVITTIMLNSVALQLTSALVSGPLKAPGQQGATTSTLPASMRIPEALQSPYAVSYGLVGGLALSVLVLFWMRKTVSGYELQAAGANATAAGFAGISVQRKLLSTMLWSGAIAGLGGAVQVLAFEGRFYSGMSPGYGFDALGVALLAGSNPLGVIPGALLFGALAKGGASIQILGVPKGITTVVLGLVILVAAIARAQRWSRDD